MPDPVALTADLIRCPSVTPEEGGALQLLQRVLEGAGFACTRVDRGGVPNLFARWGARGHPRTFGFNGHTDVVPVGDTAAWTVDPFGGEIRDGRVWGRGACDMKSGVAAFVTAAVRFVTHTPPDGAVILTITGDEEGASTDGTVALLDWMADQGEAMAVCLVGEPTSRADLGDMIKIGRRGALNARITAIGKQGHSAYPDRALNPLTALVRLCDRLASAPLDEGSETFAPSTLALTSIDTGNPATNVIPARATAALNIRFNDHHTGAGLIAWLEDQAARVSDDTGVRLDVACRISGESFVTPPGPFPDLIAGAVTAETNRTPVMSTTGGTSDARFIKAHCPVVEFGLVGNSMHQVDENAEVSQIERLTAVYERMLADWFAR
ncbi:succinyl-diaminopimelate desuccinylase [Rhodobaculum claviforme]|uniref:Succinyl-diaminopimelate desuccinylase n=1 Tax=Rhodobaculum claviforme TaxID=1549854 RepID=A0A934THN9_9RHOB|nr:succinyl-diaminopimelate desuccinylase [Rhodobaculum claviforme]MBK5926419.1 succinyl-diaminopimelate desuccinylase [Rhodobaculum claviforme]